MKSDIEQQVKKLKLISSELETAIKHSNIAAKHFESSEIPRGCAHTLALQGHLNSVNDLLKEIAKLHSLKAGT
jgi:hypothetical protein